MRDDIADANASFPLRRGGRVALTGDSLLVAGDEDVRVRLSDVEEVTVESFDWFLGLMSAALVGFGVLTLDRSAIAGAAFVVVGVVSLYWTYRKRGKVTVSVHDRAKPVSFCLDDTETFLDSMGEALDEYVERVPDAERI